MINTATMNIFRSMRLHRTLTGICTLLVPLSFLGRMHIEVMLFALCSIILYAGAGIQNAIRDRDYILPSWAWVVSAALFSIALLLSVTNHLIFLGIAIETSLGLIYNTISRKIFLGDVTVLSVTHHALPAFMSSILSGMGIGFALRLSLFMFVTFWFLIHLKNLKDKEDDRARGYKTIANNARRGKHITLLFVEISFLCMLSGYFLFGFDVLYLALLAPVFLVKCKICSLSRIGCEVKALNLMRLMVMLFLAAIIFQNTTSIDVVGPAVIAMGIYLITLVPLRFPRMISKTAS